MSSKNRKKESIDKDNYPTPLWCVERLQEAKIPDLIKARTVLEPCAGDGRIIKAFPNKEWCGVELRDVEPSCEAFFANTNFLDWAVHQPLNVFDAVVTNPPYTLALEFLQHSLTLAPHVFFLLRMGFLESEKRWDWNHEHMPDCYLLPNRPSFDGEGCDSTIYAWMHFSRKKRKRGNIRLLANTPMEIRKEAKKQARQLRLL